MKKTVVRHSITYFLLAIFLSMKLASFHVIAHADDKEHALHCTICDHLAMTNATPMMAAGPMDLDFDLVDIPVPFQVTNHYNLEISNALAADQLFSRPPPVL